MSRTERIVVYGVLALLVVHALVGAPVFAPRRVEAGEPAPEIVKARAFVVEDTDGRVRASLRVLPDGSPTLELTDTGGTLRGALRLASNGAPSLDLRHANGKPGAMITGGGNGFIAFTLCDLNGQTRISLATVPHEGMPTLSLFAKDGRSSVGFLADDVLGVGLSIDDKAENRRAWLGIDGRGAPSLELRDAEGHSRAVIGVVDLNPTDLTQPIPQDPETTSQSSVVLFDKDRKVLWRAPPR